MISKEQAFNIAKMIIPDIELRGLRITDTISNNQKLAKLPKNCWYLSYFPVLINYSSCSTKSTIFMCIDKESGEILFHNSL